MRWLSLGLAIDRLLQSQPALISYFKSLCGNCPKRLSKALGLQMHSGIEENDSDVKLNIAKAGLHLALDMCNVF
jgi:hypothetical protein